MNELQQLDMPEKASLGKFIVSNARTLVMAFILFTVVIVMTTDIRLITAGKVFDLGLEFFVILFASYGMYVTCADSGIHQGYQSEAYRAAVELYEKLKKQIEEKMLSEMYDFCREYTDRELKNTRMQYLAVVCIPYDVYLEKYMHLDRRALLSCGELSDAARKAITRANRVRRIKLTPEMILTRGKAAHYRAPLAMTPDTLKNLTFGAKIIKMCAISLGMSLIALDVIVEPSWTVFAGVCLKLATVIINGCDGYKSGLTNITVHTVGYINTQCALMQEALQSRNQSSQ